MAEHGGGKAASRGASSSGADDAPTPPPVPPVVDVEDGDAVGRTKVPREWAIENGERVLGIRHHELVAALHEDRRAELTLNAVVKTVEEWRAKVQNPDTVDEED